MRKLRIRDVPNNKRRIFSVCGLTGVCALLLLSTLMPAEGQQRPEDFGGPPRGFGSQRGFGSRGFGQRRERRPTPPGMSETGGEFTFVRAIYSSPYSPYNTWRGGSWTVDFPEADDHFITGVRDWTGTSLNISSRPEQLPLLDDRLFDFPFLYMVEPGFLDLSAEEAARLREYLLRGGFLYLDDFHGESEWRNVQEQLSKVLPEYQIVDLPLTHPIFHSYLDIDEVVQVPGLHTWVRGVTHEKGGITPHYMGVVDKHDRVVVFITRNCDFGDAWEWIDDPMYPSKYGLAAYKVAINAVIYSMTH
ncbi:MAG: DUF4159 domain-containing protein [Pyrinomonadaceae bacterium]|nr:DUF4159 domain-containing protein [Pyrinomonadaceae bacterium]